jgi:hypothetical protein
VLSGTPGGPFTSPANAGVAGTTTNAAAQTAPASNRFIAMASLPPLPLFLDRPLQVDHILVRRSVVGQRQGVSRRSWVPRDTPPELWLLLTPSTIISTSAEFPHKVRHAERGARRGAQTGSYATRPGRDELGRLTPYRLLSPDGGGPLRAARSASRAGGQGFESLTAHPPDQGISPGRCRFRRCRGAEHRSIRTAATAVTPDRS